MNIVQLYKNDEIYVRLGRLSHIDI